jgi:hypothetical protein
VALLTDLSDVHEATSDLGFLDTGFGSVFGSGWSEPLDRRGSSPPPAEYDRARHQPLRGRSAALPVAPKPGAPAFAERFAADIAAEIDAYMKAETPGGRATALDALARKLTPNADSRVAAIAELQRRGILKVPAARWNRHEAAHEAALRRADARRMRNHDQRAYIGRVTRPIAAGAAGKTLFYAALSDTRQTALEAIRTAAQPGDYVELTDTTLSPETTKALDLLPGIAKAI